MLKISKLSDWNILSYKFLSDTLKIFRRIQNLKIKKIKIDFGCSLFTERKMFLYYFFFIRNHKCKTNITTDLALHMYANITCFYSVNFWFKIKIKFYFTIKNPFTILQTKLYIYFICASTHMSADEPMLPCITLCLVESSDRYATE